MTGTASGLCPMTGFGLRLYTQKCLHSLVCFRLPMEFSKIERE